jgi:hypothetical protein
MECVLSSNTVMRCDGRPKPRCYVSRQIRVPLSYESQRKGPPVIANPLVRTIVKIEYAMLRVPLVAVDRRLPRKSKIRTSLQQCIHALDAVVEGLLAEPDRSAPQPAQPSAAQPAEPDVELEREQVAGMIRKEQPGTGELTDPDLAEVQAQLRAKHIVEEHHEPAP